VFASDYTSLHHLSTAQHTYPQRNTKQNFEKPILNSPYEYPTQHWELDEQGQPTQKVVNARRRADFITPIPKPKKQEASPDQKELVLDEGKGLFSVPGPREAE